MFANQHYSFFIQSSESHVQPPSAVLADCAPRDGTMEMDSFLQWLTHDDSASDKEQAIRSVTPKSSISDGSASSEGEQSVALPTSEIPPAEESTSMPSAMDQSAPRDSAVAGTLSCM